MLFDEMKPFSRDKSQGWSKGTHQSLLSSFVACSCHPVGSAILPFSSVTFCDPSNGDCPCKPGVAGPHCDRCMVGYWGFGHYGCRPCDCAGSCDPLTGDCISRWVCASSCLWVAQAFGDWAVTESHKESTHCSHLFKKIFFSLQNQIICSCDFFQKII